MLVDSHCHLDFSNLTADREGILSRAKSAGVVRMVNISTIMREYPTIRATAEQNEDVFCSVGVHPDHVHEDGETITAEDLIEHAKHPKVVGLGETGLDYFRGTEHMAVQQESFRQHIRAGIATGLPIIIHSRNAEEDTARILYEETDKAGKAPPAVLHCFSSRRVLAEEALKLGIYVSLSGIITFKKSQELRDIVRDLPLDHLLVETDSPFLAPEPFRGKPCEPAYVANTARVLADIKGVSFEEVSRITTENFFRLFNKVTPVS